MDYIGMFAADFIPNDRLKIEAFNIIVDSGLNDEMAQNGREGILKALQGSSSLVLIDLEMPEMDGYEAIIELRKYGFNKPIIALTAHAIEEERKRTHESGITDHLTKPVDRNTLIHVLSEYRT